MLEQGRIYWGGVVGCPPPLDPKCTPLAQVAPPCPQVAPPQPQAPQPQVQVLK